MIQETQWPDAAARSDETVPDERLSIVVPTKNEAENIKALLARLEGVLPNPLEVIFVDDSDDETPTVIETVRGHQSSDIILIHRSGRQRVGGLGGAVVAGLETAHSNLVCVMDADLQHPPELIPHLWEKATRSGADVVVASRYCADGSPGALPPVRLLISRASTVAARLAFPSHLRNVSDPMSGFFLVRKDRLQLDTLQPRGFKILLEILVRHPSLRAAEVGLRFGARHAGKSKGTPREGLRYISQLWALRFQTPRQRSCPALYSYDSSGPVLVASDAWLPDAGQPLEAEPHVRPTVRVHLGTTGNSGPSSLIDRSSPFR